jgi:formyl-CoA transferase
MSGFAHLVGEPTGPPTLPSFPLADAVTGTTGAFAVMVALFEREHSGKGQVIDISLYEPMLRIMEPFLLDYDQLGVAAMRPGNRSPHVVPRNAYRCCDGAWVALAASAQRIFERLAEAIARPELASDPRFATPTARIAHGDALDAELQAWFEAHASDEVLRVMEAAEVSVGLVYDVPAIFADPQVAERGSLVEVDDPELGPLRMVNVVPRLSRTPGAVRTAGPRLGEHTAEILAELAVGPSELEELRLEGVV